ncbi:PadR family transcriptional regulator [Deinococcus malanensis]|uniref:PadR family transcriptional regulator n=1 Tax=Deinococcus malanensis TaxID=1706855 RepID=A0ABQ2ER86_9DEIO|nr:PadR family transcriptional regulator [Deinococcus malanensis]GGK22530.1 PadR family transcriptional regulator [Deinococcus malanensis]
MNPDQLRGNLDLILLSVLERDALYGFRIIQEVKARSDGYFDFKEGSLYPALHRLTVEGLLTTEEREVGRNGKPRKYYLLSARGREALERKRAEWQAFKGALDRLA